MMNHLVGPVGGQGLSIQNIALSRLTTDATSPARHRE